MNGTGHPRRKPAPVLLAAAAALTLGQPALTAAHASCHGASAPDGCIVCAHLWHSPVEPAPAVGMPAPAACAALDGDATAHPHPVDLVRPGGRAPPVRVP